MTEKHNPHPEFRENIRERLKGQHFMHLTGFDLTHIEKGEVVGEMELELKHMQQFGFVHGGVTSTIMDIVMGFAAYTYMPEGKGVVTSHLGVDYLNPGIGERIVARGEVEKVGSKLIYCTAKVFTYKDGVETHIASGRSIMAVVDKH